MKQYHKPVLMKEVLEYLNPQENEVVVDATFGFGGHSREILKKLGKKGKLIAVDQDETILNQSKKEFKDDRITFINDNFENLKSILTKCDVKAIDGILLDLGVSSYHFDELNKGFSFDDDELDMRMNRTSGESASEIVNQYSENDIADILYEFADEYKSRRIAKAIVEERKKEPISSAKQLTEIIKRNIRPSGKINPATKTFQALRIYVNREYDVLKKVINDSVDVLNKNGRIVIISFHSGEDRIVKESFKNLAKEGRVEILTKKPLTAEFEEIRDNKRSRSAKLRSAKKV